MRPDYRSARQTPEVGNDPAARPSRLLYSTDITRCAQAWKRRRRMTICSPMVDGHRAMALCAPSAGSGGTREAQASRLEPLRRRQLSAALIACIPFFF